jgi:hypothetical protein
VALDRLFLALADPTRRVMVEQWIAERRVLWERRFDRLGAALSEQTLSEQTSPTPASPTPLAELRRGVPTT